MQWRLGRKLHKKATAGTSFFHCLFAISRADFHTIRENETAEFHAALKTYKRVYFWTIFPVLTVVLGVYFWSTWT